MKKITVLLLAAILLFTTFQTAALATETVTATPMASTVLVNGKKAAFDAYNINGNNYFKLRDLAYVLSGTEKQFNVDWDGMNNTISLISGKQFTVTGGEMTAKGAENKTAAPTSLKIYLDDKEVTFTSYNIDGNNYFKLRDIGRAFDFGVEWDDENDFVFIDTTSITTYIGTGGRGITDGGKAAAQFLMPSSIEFYERRMFIFDTYNNTVRINESNETKTLLGSFTEWDDNRFPQGGYKDDVAESSLLNRPTSGVFNSKGELIICDSANNAIRIYANGKLSTFAGGTIGYADGAADKTKFNNPAAIAIDKNGNIYIADTLNNCIRKIDTESNVTTIAGMPQTEGDRDGAAENALFRQPSGIAVNADGDVIYVSDTGNHKIKKIVNGTVTTLAGVTEETDEDGCPLGGIKNGAADKAMFRLPMGLALVDDILIVADSGNNMIRIIYSGYALTAAGSGEPGDKDGNINEAMLDSPSGILFYENVLYIADTNNNKIKRMSFDAETYKTKIYEIKEAAYNE